MIENMPFYPHEAATVTSEPLQQGNSSGCAVGGSHILHSELSLRRKHFAGDFLLHSTLLAERPPRDGASWSTAHSMQKLGTLESTPPLLTFRLKGGKKKKKTWRKARSLAPKCGPAKRVTTRRMPSSNSAQTHIIVLFLATLNKCIMLEMRALISPRVLRANAIR